MSPSEIAQRLEFALAVSREAAKLILSYYLTPELVVDLKRDRSPVTAADRGAEELIRDRIAKRFPGDGVFGEEFGETPGQTGVRWVLDPVDGTKAFIHGVPLFGTLIGLEANGELLAGVCLGHRRSLRSKQASGRLQRAIHHLLRVRSEFRRAVLHE